MKFVFSWQILMKFAFSCQILMKFVFSWQILMKFVFSCQILMKFVFSCQILMTFVFSCQILMKFVFSCQILMKFVFSWQIWMKFVFSCQILMKFVFSWQIFKKNIFKLKFHEYQYSWSRDDLCILTDGQTNVTKLTDTFHNFAKAPKKMSYWITEDSTELMIWIYLEYVFWEQLMWSWLSAVFSATIDMCVFMWQQYVNWTASMPTCISYTQEHDVIRMW